MALTGLTAAAGRDQYLQLLVAQLRHQDPINPVQQEDFIQQLAQFATLEGIEKLNSQFEQFLQMSELAQSTGLIGKTATFRDSATGADRSAEIDEVRMEDGKVVLIAEGQQVSIDSLIGVRR